MTAVSPLDTRTAAPMRARRSPLAERAQEFAALRAHGVRMGEEPFLSQVNLRVTPDSPVVAQVEQALDAPLPSTPNRVTENGGISALWLGPDEWLLVAADGAAERVVTTAEAALGDSFGSVVDISANRTTVRLSGSNAREVLEKLCSLDLHPRSFGSGQCAQTLLGRTQVILWQVTEEPSYRIMVRCSFADYLADLLLDAIDEFTQD